MEIAQLKTKRARVKSQVTRLQTFFQSHQDCAAVDAQVRLKSLEEHWIAFDAVQQEIENLTFQQESGGGQLTQENESERGNFEEKYYAVAATVQRILNKDAQSQADLQRPGSSNADSEESTQASSLEKKNKLKLPEIKLPEFNGEYTRWLFFRNSFESTVHNDSDLSGAQKHQYLVGVLTGEARQVIEGFDSGSYEQAWRLLRRTYDNEMIIIDTHLDQLLNFPSVSKEDKVDSMRRLVWHIQTHLSSLKSLHQAVEHWDAIIIHLAKRKLEYPEQREWQNYIKKCTPQNMPKLEDFMKFVTDCCHTLRIINQGKPMKPKLTTTTAKNSQKRVVLTTATLKCKICNKDHQTFKCDELEQLSPNARKKRIMEKRLCINCLNAGHYAKECRASTCKKCSGKHNTILHLDQPKQQENSESSRTEQATTFVVAHGVDASSWEEDDQVLLSTAQVYVRDVAGRQILCRALLDPGSQSNLITTDLLQKLGISWEKGSRSMTGLHQMPTHARKMTHCEISSVHKNYTIKIKCNVLPTITVRIPQDKINKNQIIIPENIQLADPAYDQPGNIDMLLGAGPYWKVVVGAPRNKVKGRPALQNTEFGWIVGGEIENPNCSTRDQALACLAVTNEQLHKQIENFWKVETVPEERNYTVEDKACEDYYKKTTCRRDDGRFIVRLPMRFSVRLGNSRDQAQRRLAALERRFERQSEMRKAYCEFMRDYERSGHMTEVSEAELLEFKETYFIPHQPVIRADSLTTKLRVVFDASAKTTSGSSLNDRLMPGPNLQKDLHGILIRFRTHQYVITADIAQMFRQILVDQRDRSLQLILWRENSGETSAVKIFKLNTVTYGTASAPYHALRCLKELSIQHQNEYPIAAKIIAEDFYMDDVLTGSRTCQLLKETQRQLFELLKRGQFILRKWRSNEPQVLQHLDKGDSEFFTIERDTVKTLGLLWSATTDVLQYRTNTSEQVTLTKRAVLSRVSQIFDPLGLVSSVLITGKILMQQLWAEDLQWDEPLPTQYISLWTQFEESLSELSTLRIPRNVNPNNISATMDIHGFGDASQSAIGACIYALSTNENGDMQSHIVCAKSRVAPLKVLSMPRLELEAALLLSQLYNAVRTSLIGRIKRVSMWSDSTIVLGWLKTEPHALKTFVANRVAKIQEITNGIEWCHVPSEDNPADILSRGTTTTEISNNDLWWFGPSWLTEIGQRPKYTENPETDLPEMRTPTVVLISTQCWTTFLLHKYSSFQKLCRIIAYCCRVFSKSTTQEGRGSLPRKLNLKPPDASELAKAERIILRWVQEAEFQPELRCLLEGRNLPRKSTLMSLTPFVDVTGLIRVGGRLKHASLSEDQKHPIILPQNHHVTRLLMREEHERMMHCSPEQLLHHIRQRYWPLRGRRLAKRTIKACLRCFRYNPKTPDVRMGDLPKERVSNVSRPFTITGVDYAGPFNIRESRRRGRVHVSKGYVAAFVCFSTKAVHLEMVTSLTTEAFLAALSRFAARRGLCLQLFSDNGSNFVGAAKELQEIQTFLRHTDRDKTQR